MWDGEVERKDGQGNTKNGERKRRKQRERHIYIASAVVGRSFWFEG